MYHPKIIESNLSAALSARNPLTNEPILSFTPRYRTISEVQSFASHYSTLWDDDSQSLRRPLNSEEDAFIASERLLCQLDYLYWATRYVKIIDLQGRLILYRPNVAQRIIQALCAENELARIAINNINLKARQLGVSHDAEIRILHRVQFHPHVNAVIASSDPEKSEKMSAIMERALDNQPRYLKPRQTRGRVGELIEFGDQDSAITIQHGSQFTGIARGSNPHVVHLSELCDFKNPGDIVDSSLLKAVHDNEWTMMIFESTAIGRHNWWHKTWNFAKAEWDRGRSRFRPIFLPWFVGTDVWPTETWLRAHPIPSDWSPSDMIIHHADRCQTFVRSNPLLRQFLGSDWSLPRHQMWFYEVDREEAQAKGDLNKFLREMPADDLEAFQSTAHSAFDADIITIYRESSASKIPDVYGIIGDEIPQRLHPAQSEIDRSKSTIEIHANYGQSSYHFQLIPLKWSGYSSSSGLGKLFIWCHPEKDTIYNIGVDTSDGVGLDRSCIEVLGKGDFHRNDFQAAEYTHDYVNAFDLWPICMAIGTYFSVKRDGRQLQPKLAIECRGNGEATQLELRKRGWTNFHIWVRYDSKRIDRAKSGKIGIFTMQWFRDLMMDWLVKFLRDGWIDIHSPWFVDEMADLERDEYQQEMKASYGGHDDRIITLGFALISMYDLEIRAGKKSPRDRLLSKSRALAYPSYQPGDQARDRADADQVWMRREPGMAVLSGGSMDAEEEF